MEHKEKNLEKKIKKSSLRAANIFEYKYLTKEILGLLPCKMSEIGNEGLKEGDLLVKNGHVEFFKSFTDDAREIEMAWTWGKVYSELPDEKRTTKQSIEREYKGVWRFEGEKLDE